MITMQDALVDYRGDGRARRAQGGIADPGFRRWPGRDQRIDGAAEINDCVGGPDDLV